MASLRIDLQEGFTEAQVTVLLDGEALAQLDRARTNPMTGFADSITLDVSAGHHVVEVEVDGTRLQAEIDVAGDTFVGFNAATGEVFVSEEPFGYG